jgi:Domain of unknown function (DUF5658)
MPERASVHYPNHYAWLVLVASLDIMMTWVILHVGGVEANPIAKWVLHAFGLPGMVTFKFALIIVAILVGEAVGRRDKPKGRRFLEYAIAISTFPVILALVLLVVSQGGENIG